MLFFDNIVVFRREKLVEYNVLAHVTVIFNFNAIRKPLGTAELFWIGDLLMANIKIENHSYIKDESALTPAVGLTIFNSTVYKRACINILSLNISPNIDETILSIAEQLKIQEKNESNQNNTIIN